MSGKSDYLAGLLLAWLKGGAMPSAPAGLYVGLYDGDPDAAGVEVTTSVRPAGRLPVTFGSVSADAGVSSMANTAAVAFGTAAGAVEVSHFAIFDAASGGNLLYSAVMSNGPEAVEAGTYLVFPVGSLIVREG